MPAWFGFIVRRLISSIVMLLVLTMIVFFAFSRIPSNPAAFLIDLRYATPEQVEHANPDRMPEGLEEISLHPIQRLVRVRDHVTSCRAH